MKIMKKLKTKAYKARVGLNKSSQNWSVATYTVSVEPMDLCEVSEDQRGPDQADPHKLVPKVPVAHNRHDREEQQVQGDDL
jgi:hypothetical protein